MGTLDKELLTPINIYASSVEPEKYVRLLLSNVEKHMDINVIVVGDFNTPLSPLDISTRQNTSKDMRALSEKLEKLGLMDLYRALHPQEMEYTFFSSAHGTFSRIDRALGYKSKLHKITSIRIIPSSLSNHNVKIYCKMMMWRKI